MTGSWYLAEEGSGQEGPLTEAEVLRRLDASPDGPGCLIWSPGLDDWHKINDVSDFLRLTQETLPPIPQPESQPLDSSRLAKPRDQKVGSALPAKSEAARTNSRGSAFFGGDTHPWRRFSARFVETSIWVVIVAILCAVAVSIFAPDLFKQYMRLSNNLLFAGVFFYATWIPVEAIFLAAVGTTPAKWCFGISVTRPNGQKLDFVTALRRASMAWVRGEACGVPLVMAITRLVAYSRLTNKGITSWDEECGAVVRHKPWGVIRALVCIGLVIWTCMVLTILYGVGSS